MQIGLIDVDNWNNLKGCFPNLPLMKLSAWHKEQGNLVEWYDPSKHYDLVYMSKVFSFTNEPFEEIHADQVVKGGSGYAIQLIDGKEVFDQEKHSNLPDHIEHIFPDYSLYGITNTAHGFMSRGCPRGCNFCIVGKKEGRCSRKVADLSEFWNGQKNIVLCDPNILACKDWKDLLDQLIRSKATIDFNQGLDIRMMTTEKIKMLNKIKIKQLHFAWDRYQDKDAILPKFKMWKEYAKHTRDKDTIVYTIVNYDTTLEQDLERIYTLRELGLWAYVMIYDKEHCDPIYKQLSRWVNNRFVFAKCERFEDYTQKKTETENDPTLWD